jgi:hypothetical protein
MLMKDNWVFLMFNISKMLHREFLVQSGSSIIEFIGSLNEYGSYCSFLRKHVKFRVNDAKNIPK